MGCDPFGKTGLLGHEARETLNGLRRIMIEYRVTKYDPSLRDARGAYSADDWTSVTDIGHAFGGVTLTDTEYQRIEQA